MTEQFKVGDRVQFKEWDKQEFGGEGICAFCVEAFCFDCDLKRLCGAYATISKVGKDWVEITDCTVEGRTTGRFCPEVFKHATPVVHSFNDEFGTMVKQANERERSKIIAVDFDGTLCTNKYPDIGEVRADVIQRLVQEQADGARIVLWTCREGDLLHEAIGWCKAHGINFDAINENLPDEIDKWGTDPRKVGADEYWDDKAVKV